MSEIVFGTDGWRARMGHAFTFANVRLVARAYADFLKKTWPGREITVLVNYDTRYLSDHFAAEAAKVLSLEHINVFLAQRDAPAPALTLAIRRRQLQGAMNFTNSFDQANYNGIKIFNHLGAPAMPSATLVLEETIRRTAHSFVYRPQYADEKRIVPLSLQDDYLAYLRERVRFDLIQKAGLQVVVDNLYGTSRDYLDRILLDHDIETYVIHNYSDSHFGGFSPSCDEASLVELRRTVTEKKAHCGIATDIDGDRFALVDENGRLIPADLFLPALMEYLITVRKLDGDIVKSIATSQQIDHVGRYYARKVHTTPVGSKFLCDTLIHKKAFIGVETPGGAVLNGVNPAKDGILFGLLALEMMAFHRASLSHLLADFHGRFPAVCQKEISLPKTAPRCAALQRLWRERGLQEHGARVNYLDGVKLVYPDSWLLIRESGTRPVIRIGAEAPNAAEAARLIRLGRKILGYA